ncbi:TetR/AcrR family transcriptional regulator [Criibacterium bergeronii]|uniref:TetR/AcrR family transcriptional regulator n=1 Tax=Criibacterium bergeronii TaxID=1871336 RepID=A0A552V0V8_9FIRM|nr:TetR/AcrR family transcriptional regulator [Criibacterium bergeronii]TRW24121.1 TetR/AcrR family transcriptional regulator [Criibacterium bergeronii]
MTDASGFDLTHKKIIESGKLNFLNDGYERSNLRKICKDAGVTTGAFYRHFNDKEDLFVSLVAPLAKELLSFYDKFEDESFRDIEKNYGQDLAEINIEGSIESTLYMFSRKELFNLLIYKAYGTKYDNFIELIVEKEDINRHKAFQIISKKKNIKAEIPKEAMHLLNHAYINALCEIVIHSKTEEEVKTNTRIISKFFYDGWEKLRGF